MLGPTVVTVHGAEVPLRPRELQLLAVLAMTHPDPIATSAIAQAIWPAGPPRTARQAIQNHVARIRARLGDEAVSTVAGGYRLGPGWSLDTERFDADVARARQAVLGNDAALACTFLRTAIGRSRGEAFFDLEHDLAAASRVRRRQGQLAAEDELVLAMLASEDLVAGLAEAAALVEREPSRETRWLMLALAHYRGGDRRQSLLTLQRARTALLDAAGLDVGPALARLEAQVLDDDRALLHAAPASLTGHSTTATLHDRSGVFVGRADLLEDVQARLDEAIRERSAVSIDIAGPPGVGKTALADRIATQAMIDGWHVVSARCYPAGARLLEPLGELVRQIVAYEANPSDTLGQELLTDLATLWRAQPIRTARGDLGEAILEVVAQHAERSPTLVVIDDAHHLSETVRRLLHRVRAMQVPVVVVTVRAGDAPPVGEHDVGVALEGLGVAEAQHLFELLAGRTVPMPEAERLQNATDGIPLLVRHVATGRAIPDDAAGRLPGGVGGRILLDSLRRMSPAAQQVVSLLAVAGGPTPIEIVAAAVGLDEHEAVAAADEALAGGTLRAEADRRPDLISDMLRDALLGEIAEQARIDLHERLGSAIIAAGGDALLAAPHLLAAAVLDPDRAITAARSAAERAGAATMHIEAAAFLDAAATLATERHGPAASDTLRLRLDQAECLRRSGDPTHIDIVWNVVRAADTTGDRDVFALGAIGLCQLGQLTEAGTLNQEVADVVERAIITCPDPTIRARCAGQASLFYSMSGRVDLCRAHFQDAIEQARTAGDDATLLDVLSNVYISLNHPDDWPLRAELAGELLGLAERLDDDDARFAALHLYFSTQVQFGDPLLRTTFAAQRALASSLRSAARRWMLGYQAAALAHLDGRLDDALRIGAETFEGGLVAQSRSRAGHWMNMLVIRLAQGRGHELADDIDAIVEAQPGLPGWRAVAAWLAALRGDRERVLHECDLLERGAGLPRDMAWSGAAMLLGRAVATTGNAERVAALRTLLEPYTGIMTWIGSCTVGPFDVALAELALVEGDRDRAARYLASAQRMVDRLRAPVFQPDLDRIGLELG